MNIILQHWNGNMPEWAQLAEKTFRIYAEKIGCEYELVRGMPLGAEVGPHAQKLIYLDEKYDEYDQTLMLDMDTIATNVFEDVFKIKEIGVLHDRAMQGTSRTPAAAPLLYKKEEPVFFGNFIKLNRNQRQALRKYADWSELGKAVVDPYSGDEIILHYLFHKSNILSGLKYTDMCMRCDGTSIDDIHFRLYNRLDKKFANQPEDSDPDASIIHFCRDRKKFLPGAVKKYFGEI